MDSSNTILGNCLFSIVGSDSNLLESPLEIKKRYDLHKEQLTTLLESCDKQPLFEKFYKFIGFLDMVLEYEKRKDIDTIMLAFLRSHVFTRSQSIRCIAHGSINQ